MRLPGRRGQTAAQRPMQIPPTIICPVCGLRNEITVRFCRNCGLPLGAPRDPVRGTTTKRADLPGDRGNGIAAIVGLLAIVGIVGVAGLLIFRGFQSGVVTPGGSPGGSLVAQASLAPAATLRGSLPAVSVDPAASVPPAASAEPGATQPVSTDEPTATDEPTSRPDRTPVPVTTVTSWTCKSGSIADPLKGKWRISRTSWNSGTSTDRLTMSLTRVSGTTRKGATVEMAFLSPGKASSSLGISRPLGDRALVLTFVGPISVGTPQVGKPGMRAIESVDVRRDDAGVTHAVIGINGTGCARLNAADWKSGSDATQTADLVLDVRR